MTKSSIIPEATVLPKYFVSHRTYMRRQVSADASLPAGGKVYEWALDPTASDPTLTQQVRHFIETEDAVLVTQALSSPTVKLYETGDRRLYILAASIMYISATEGADDQPREVDGPGSVDAGGQVPGELDRGDLA